MLGQLRCGVGLWWRGAEYLEWIMSVGCLAEWKLFESAESDESLHTYGKDDGYATSNSF